MLLLDSLYINNRGGRVLLDYLVEEIEKTGSKVFYLFDERTRGAYDFVPQERKQFMTASLRNRHRFYRKNKNRFSSILCFGNLAPTIKLKVPVYVYFHQRLFLAVPGDMSLKRKLPALLKKSIFHLLLRHADYFLVQTASMKKELLTKRKDLKEQQVQVFPFYPHLKFTPVSKKSDTFLYVSSAADFKNHLRLLDAFAAFYDKTKRGKLILTVDHYNSEVNARIDDLVYKEYPIHNLGLMKYDDLASWYAQSEYVVYPSLTESFGLGVIEAIEAGCKVIGADLEYMHAVCKPSLVFDPLSVESIENALHQAVKGELPPSEVIAKDKVGEMIELITKVSK